MKEVEQIAGTSALALAFQSSPLSKPSPEIRVVPGLKADDLEGVAKTTSRGQLARAAFFGSGGILSATLGRIHPYLPKGQIHPSTSYGLRSLIRHLEFGQPKPVPRITAHLEEGSAAVFGGPVANLHARLLMGCGGISPLFGVNLPVIFHCPSPDSEAIKGKIEPWSVIVDGRGSKAECLVVTSLPMSDNDGDRLAIFSGLHGAGTRAIDFVLRDERVLERLYRETKILTAWQAVIDVNARNTHTPRSIGDFKVYEIIGIDFDDPKNHVRNHLHMEKKRVEELVEMLPPVKKVDLSDPSNTGVVLKLEEQDLWKERHRGNLAEVSPRLKTKPSAASHPQYQSDPRRLTAPSARSRGVRVSRQLDEASMNHTEIGAANSPKTTKRGPGRPPKEKSDATLTRRLEIRVTDEDFEMLKAIKRHSGLASLGQVIRAAVHKDHESIFGTRRVKK